VGDFTKRRYDRVGYRTPISRSVIVTGAASDWGNIFVLRTSNGNLASVEGSMIDAVFTVAVFRAALVLCIVGFGA
jgi:hypothetical protein